MRDRCYTKKELSIDSSKKGHYTEWGVIGWEGNLPEGRITPSGALIYVTDHLGSVRAVVEGTAGDVLMAADYSAYGGRSDVQAGGFAPAAVPEGITLRDAFSGKEDQGPDFSLPWLDFGARAYSPALRRWMVPDPLGEKYPAVSPYAYCAGDPVNYVDPTGEKRRVVINKAKKTITVNATYFVPHMDTRLYRSMKSALSIYNKKFTNFKYNYEGTEYSVRFNLKMSSYYQKKTIITQN